MVSASRISIAAGLVCALAAVAGTPAFAGCKRMAFSVNDYGKEGPTKDSQDLLDKHIATWAAEQGIEKYTIGKKDTTCELFLNFIVFDEHTCTTRATVCWGGDKLPSAQVAKSTPKDTPSKPSDKSQKSADATPGKPVEKAIETSTPVTADAAKPAAEKSADASPVDSSTSKPAATPASVETGTIPLTNKDSEPVAPPKTADAAAPSEGVTVSDRDAVSAAAAAAERAADAAERAAAAAEKALAMMEKAAAESKGPSASAGSPAGSAASPLVAPVQPAPTAKP